MGKLTTSFTEKGMLQHLQLGGTLRDQVGSELLSTFALKTSSEHVGGLMVPYQLTTKRLEAMYAAVVEALMPNPTINAGGPLLVPTAFFMEPHRLETILWLAKRDLARDDARREGRAAVDPPSPEEPARQLIEDTSGVLPLEASQDIPAGIACLSRDDRYTYLIVRWALEWARHMQLSYELLRGPNAFPITNAGGLKAVPQGGCASVLAVGLAAALLACALR
jgi:hypothetical protein